jgi:hypothetical protein
MAPKHRLHVEREWSRQFRRHIWGLPALQPIARRSATITSASTATAIPAKLEGTDIPLEAGILAVADAFTAMVENRPYSPPMSAEDACRELERCAGTQFDPEVVGAFVQETRGGTATVG